MKSTTKYFKCLFKIMLLEAPYTRYLSCFHRFFRKIDCEIQNHPLMYMYTFFTGMSTKSGVNDLTKPLQNRGPPKVQNI